MLCLAKVCGIKDEIDIFLFFDGFKLIEGIKLNNVPVQITGYFQEPVISDFIYPAGILRENSVYFVGDFSGVIRSLFMQDGRWSNRLSVNRRPATVWKRSSNT